MRTERQVGLDALFEAGQSQLLEAGDLALRERLVGEVGQRRPAPERERLAQLGGGARGIAAGERSPTLFEEALEPVSVQALRIDVRRTYPGARVSNRPSPRLLRSRET